MIEDVHFETDDWKYIFRFCFAIELWRLACENRVVKFFSWQSLHGPKNPLPSCIHPSSYIFRMILLPCFSRCHDLKFTAYFFMWHSVHPFPTLSVSYAPDVLIYRMPLFLITSQNHANCTDFTLNLFSVLKHPAALNSFSLGGIKIRYQKCLTLRLLMSYIQGGSNMTGTDLRVNKPQCAAAVRPCESEAPTSTLPPARVRTCSVLSGSC